MNAMESTCLTTTATSPPASVVVSSTSKESPSVDAIAKSSDRICELQRELEATRQQAAHAEETLTTYKECLRLLTKQMKQMMYHQEQEHKADKNDDDPTTSVLFPSAREHCCIDKELVNTQETFATIAKTIPNSSDLMDLQNTVQMIVQHSLLLSKEAAISVQDLAQAHKATEHFQRKTQMAETTIQKLVTERNHWIHRNEKLQTERKVLKAAYKELQQQCRSSTKHQIEWYVSTAIAAHEMQLQHSKKLQPAPRSRTTTVDSVTASEFEDIASNGDPSSSSQWDDEEEDDEVISSLECQKSTDPSEKNSVESTPKPVMGRVGFGSCGALGFTNKQPRFDHTIATTITTSLTDKQQQQQLGPPHSTMTPQQRAYEPLQLIARTNSHDSTTTTTTSSSSSSLKRLKARKHHLFSPQHPQTPVAQVPLIHPKDFMLSPEEEQDTTTCPISSVSSWKGEDSLNSSSFLVDSPGLSLHYHHSPSVNSWQAEISCESSVLRSLAMPTSDHDHY
jgi:hypothetical protein